VGEGVDLERYTKIPVYNDWISEQAGCKEWLSVF
jgi:hypothetical protein